MYRVREKHKELMIWTTVLVLKLLKDSSRNRDRKMTFIQFSQEGPSRRKKHNLCPGLPHFVNFQSTATWSNTRDFGQDGHQVYGEKLWQLLVCVCIRLFFTCMRVHCFEKRIISPISEPVTPNKVPVESRNFVPQSWESGTVSWNVISIYEKQRASRFPSVAC